MHTQDVQGLLPDEQGLLPDEVPTARRSKPSSLDRRLAKVTRTTLTSCCGMLATTPSCKCQDRDEHSPDLKAQIAALQEALAQVNSRPVKCGSSSMLVHVLLLCAT